LWRFICTLKKLRNSDTYWENQTVASANRLMRNVRPPVDRAPGNAGAGKPDGIGQQKDTVNRKVDKGEMVG